MIKFPQSTRMASRLFGRFAGDGAALALPQGLFRPELQYAPVTSSVAILGAGNGGLALAGYLAQRGQHVSLWNRSPERVEAVTKRGGIQLTLPGSSAVLARIGMATANLTSALHGARLVLVAVPASGHADVARACAPHLRDGQAVLLLPGRTGGALEFRRVLREAGCRASVLLGEANTFPLAARNVGPAAAAVFGTKREMRIAALPAQRTADLMDLCRPVLPMVLPGRSVLHTGLANVGAILHPTIALMNAGRIEGGQSFDFYTEGVTNEVVGVLADADAERLRIAEAFGVATSSLQEWIAAAYGHHATTMKDAVGGNPAYVGIKAPTTLQHRYLTEDVPTGLIPLIELGEAAGVVVPTLRRLEAQARTILGGQRWKNSRTLEALGLEGLDPAGIRSVVFGQSTASGGRKLLVHAVKQGAYAPRSPLGAFAHREKA